MAETLTRERALRPIAGSLWPAVVAGVLATTVIVLGWRGADWPAQLYRADLFDRAGFTQWHNQWYGGHHTLGYSILFPPLGALIGVSTVAIIACVVASWMFGNVAGSRFSPGAARVAALWFAIGSTTNVAVGRVTFALGLALALAAVAAMLRTSWWAVLFAIAAPLASPVAGVFLAIVASAAWLTSRRADERAPPRLSMAITAGALLPIAVLSLSFPEGGRFPFRFGYLMLSVGVSAVVALTTPRRWNSLRAGAVLYGVIAIALFFVPNPLGGNLARLAMFVGGPVLAGILWPRRKALLIVVGVPLIVWQWQPAFDAVVDAPRDPSAHEAYYEPLLDFFSDKPMARIEIPFTRRHWETHFVARHVALARGWQRQLDIEFNSLFYEPGALTESSYLQWLSTNAISYVALPNAALDESAIGEASLLRAGVTGLRPVWNNADWQVWQVTDTAPLVQGAARLVQLDDDAFTLYVDSPGDVLVRIRYSSHWDLDGPGCLVESPEGWTLLRASQSGSLRVRQDVSDWVPLRGDHNDHCPSP